MRDRALESKPFLSCQLSAISFQLSALSQTHRRVLSPDLALRAERGEAFQKPTSNLLFCRGGGKGFLNLLTARRGESPLLKADG